MIFFCIDRERSLSITGYIFRYEEFYVVPSMKLLHTVDEIFNAFMTFDHVSQAH